MALYASSYSYRPDRIELSETYEKDKSVACYTIERKGYNQTMLTIDYYIAKNLVNELLFKRAEKKKMEAIIQQSLVNLGPFAKELNIPDEAL